MRRVGAKGQVTIPAAVRKQLGLVPGTAIEFVVDGDTVRIARPADAGRGVRLVERLRGRGTARMTTDEILALTRS